MSDAAIKNAVNDTGIFMQDMEERLRYINRQMAIMDYNTDMRVSREEGISIGLTQGREEGISIGRTQGREEMALSMLRDNEPIEKIAKYSRLPLERIQELAKELK